MAETWTMTVHPVRPERPGGHPTGARRIVVLLLVLTTPAGAGAVRCLRGMATIRRKMSHIWLSCVLQLQEL